MDVPRNQVILLVVGEMAFFFSVINEFHSVVKGQAEFLFNAALRGASFINVKSLRPEPAAPRFAQHDGQGLERPQSALTPPAAECDRIGSHFRPAGSNSLVVAGLLRQLLISRLRQEVMKPVLATKRPVTRGPGASAGEPLLKPMPLSPVFGHESAATPHRPTLA